MLKLGALNFKAPEKTVKANFYNIKPADGSGFAIGARYFALEKNFII